MSPGISKTARSVGIVVSDDGLSEFTLAILLVIGAAVGGSVGGTMAHKNNTAAAAVAQR